MLRFALLAVALLAAWPAQAGAHYAYRSAGFGRYHCAQVTPSGGMIRFVDDRYCTADR